MSVKFYFCATIGCTHFESPFSPPANAEGQIHCPKCEELMINKKLEYDALRFELKQDISHPWVGEKAGTTHSAKKWVELLGYPNGSESFAKHAFDMRYQDWFTYIRD